MERSSISAPLAGRGGKPRERATILDIAARAGVSKSTVSLVLRASPLVKPQTRARVHETMAALGYVYNRAAANLRQARSSIVGMVINDLTNPFFAELAVGIERTLASAGHIPLIANTAENLVRQAEVVASMREHGVAGLILCPALETGAAEIANLSRAGIPIVLAIRRIEGVRLSCVLSDNFGGAYQATRHLIGLGHRQIAFLGGRALTSVRADRVAGYCRALAEANLAVDPALSVESMPTKFGGLAAFAAAYALPQRPSAAVCFNDVVAIGAILAAQQRGLSVGRDIAIVGFDDIAEAALMSPALSSVAVDGLGLGDRAAGLLLDSIRSGDRQPEHFVGQARLVVRQSCGAGQNQHVLGSPTR
jgi:LacI family transcriptional regulator